MPTESQYSYYKPDQITFLKSWFAEVPAKHFTLGMGHKGGVIKKIAELLNVEPEIIENA